MARYYCISRSTVIHFFVSWSKKFWSKIIFVQQAQFKYFFQKFMLYNYIRENNLRAFSAHENIFAPKKRITVW